jgi:hypothetical protein
MIENVRHTAEEAAASTSRRVFLGSLWRCAWIVTATAAALSAVSGEVRAARRSPGSGRCPPRCYKVKGKCFCPR